MAGESGPVEHGIGECQCPGTPHANGDVVWLRAKADLNMGLAVQEALRQSGSLRGDGQTAVMSVLIRYGVVAWNVRNEDGPVPVHTDAVIERIGWSREALSLSAKCRELYWDTVLAPLAPTSSASVPSTRDDNSTSASPESGLVTPISSAPSSRSGSATGTKSRPTGK